MIVSSRAEEVSQWMPGQTPHESNMCRLHPSYLTLVAITTGDQRRITVATDLPDQPEEDGTVRASAGENLLMNRMP